MTRGRGIILFAVGILLGLCIRIGVDQAAIEAIKRERDESRAAADTTLDLLLRIVGAEVMCQQAEPRRGPAT